MDLAELSGAADDIIAFINHHWSPSVTKYKDSCQKMTEERDDRTKENEEHFLLLLLFVSASGNCSQT